MVALVTISNRGKAEYTLDKAEDIAKLNKTGIETGSTATLCDTTGLRIFYFTANDTRTDGTWKEL